MSISRIAMPSREASVSWPDYVLAGSIGTLALLAWLSLWLWGRSPGGHLLMHGARHVNLSGSGLFYYGALFVLGWTLMTIAMMLPTAVPLLLLFRRMAGSRPNSAGLMALLVAGYLAVWILFGIVAQLAGRLLGGIAGRWSWVQASPWAVPAALLAVAGLYQFSSLKYACLEKCRTPMSFLIARWQGGTEVWQAARIGIDHGIYCVGCCWSLMLLMFLMGAGSLGWMLILGIVMALEKNLPWGRKLSAPVGGVLLLAAAMVAYRAGF